MEIRGNHWLKACALAVTLHAVVLVGLRSRTVGKDSPAMGPVIEMATALPGVIGSVNEDVDVISPDKTVETGDPDKDDVKEPIERETQKTESVIIEPEPQKAEPVVTEPEPQKTEPVVTEPEPQKVEPVVTEPEPQKTEPVITESEPQKTEPAIIKKQAKIKRKKKKRRKITQKKKIKRKKVIRKKKVKRSVASKRGNARKGSAGAKRGGGGRSNANAGAVNRYASRVRARILSRRPSSGGRRGTAVIIFQISTSGGLSWARISRSSGNGTLDRKALGSVRRSSPFPRPPAGSRTSQLRFSIPFRFR